MAFTQPLLTETPVDYPLTPPSVLVLGYTEPWITVPVELFPDPPTEGQLYPLGDTRDYLE